MAATKQEPHNALTGQQEMNVRTNCPYCGFENHSLLVQTYRPQIVVCNIDEGGCDRAYAVEFDVIIEATTYEIK